MNVLDISNKNIVANAFIYHKGTGYGYLSKPATTDLKHLLQFTVAIGLLMPPISYLCTVFTNIINV